MDYIEGENLNEMVKRNGPLSEAKAVEYIRKVGDALDYIHSRNMTHFDVKPANIMVRRSDDQPILIDFGLSKQYDAHGDATSTLMQGVSHGYSPIELYNPGSLSSFSPQTDVYSLGATLYFLLTGNVPPSASDVLENGLSIPSSISDSNSSAIQKAMSISRTKRPQNIVTFVEQLSINDQQQDSYQEPTSENNEATVFINPELAKYKDIDHQDTITYKDNEEEEYKPSSLDRFVTNISSTNCLINTFSVPNSRKLLYFFVHILLIILSIPLGWILWLIFFNRLKGALKKLFFPLNISDFDEGSDYSKAKCWGVISIPLIVILIEGAFIVYTERDNHSRKLQEYVAELNSKAPYYMMEAQITSIELKGNDLIYNCETSDIIHNEREVLNKQNVELWKPILAVEDSIFNLYDIKRYIFRFRNNGKPTGEVKFSKLELDDYRKIDNNSKASYYLHSYLSLQKAFLPMQIENGVVLKDVSISQSGEGFDYKEVLKFTFEDSDEILSQKYGSNLGEYIKSIIPGNFPFWLEYVTKCTDGISYQINQKGNTGKEILLYQSEQLTPTIAK